MLLKLEEGCSDAYKERERQCYVEAEKQGLHLEELLHTLKEEILKIEVISSRGRQFIYFPKHPILTKLSNATRDRIMEEVSRSTQREKIKSLLQFKDEIFAEITHNFEL